MAGGGRGGWGFGQKHEIYVVAIFYFTYFYKARGVGKTPLGPFSPDPLFGCWLTQLLAIIAKSGFPVRE